MTWERIGTRDLVYIGHTVVEEGWHKIGTRTQLYISYIAAPPEPPPTGWHKIGTATTLAVKVSGVTPPSPPPVPPEEEEKFPWVPVVLIIGGTALLIAGTEKKT